MVIVKYETEEEKTAIIIAKEAEGYILVEVQNTEEGNFLGFQEPGWLPPVDVPEAKDVDVLGAEHVKLDLVVLEVKRLVASLTIEINKKKSEVAELTQQNQVLGSLLSSLQAQVLAIKGGTDVNV